MIVTEQPLATGFLESLGNFFTDLAAVKPVPLLIAVSCFIGYLTIRSRAYLNVVRAAFPDAEIPWRKIWGAYIVGFSFNAVVPARGGNVVKVFLVHSSIKGSNYPAVVSSFAVDFLFDLTIAIPVLGFAFTQGVFPKPPDFASVNAADLKWLAVDPTRTLFLLSVIAVLITALFAFLSVRVKAFWAKVRQGLAILFDRDRYLREVWLVQFVAWLLECVCFWFMLEAFGIQPSVERVLLVLGCQAIASSIPFTPGGAGVMQALIVKALAAAAAADVVAAFAVGQEIAIALTTFTIGFAALVWMFGFKSIGEVRRAGHHHRKSQQ